MIGERECFLSPSIKAFISSSSSLFPFFLLTEGVCNWNSHVVPMTQGIFSVIDLGD